MTEIVNAAPMVINLGIKDLSRRVVPLIFLKFLSIYQNYIDLLKKVL
jgi:hypothetical protein